MFPLYSQTQSEAAKKWFASQTSLGGYNTQEKGRESQLLYPPPPTIASSLVECVDVGDTLEVGSKQMPLHQPDVTKNHALLHELMLNYNIIGVSGL